jgi:hypothetical protein
MITITGTASIFDTDTISFKIVITNNCPTATITTTSFTNCCIYYIGRSTMTISFADWTP